MITQQRSSSPAREDVRALLDAHLSPPLTGEELTFLELRQVVGEIERTRGDAGARARVLAAAAQTVRDLRRAQGRVDEGRPQRAAAMATDDSARRYALSRLLAIEAERLSEVVDFRSRRLDGQVMAWEELEAWVKGQADADGPPSRFVEVALPDEAELRWTGAGLAATSDLPLSEAFIGGGYSHKILAYGLPGRERVRHQAVRAGGVLHELLTLTEKLAATFAWTKDQATVFVLSGVTPYVAGVRRETEVRSEYPAASRLRLEVDPVVSPQEVVSVYSGLRQKVLEGTCRPLSDKHLKLAVFAAERRPPAKWGEVMASWNEAYPEHLYEKETIFARDCTAAQRRLLRPRLRADALLG